MDNNTKNETFMKMFEVQAGLGFGVKKSSLVWVFETPDALATFSTAFQGAMAIVALCLALSAH